MKRALVLSFLVLALAACGSNATSTEVKTVAQEEASSTQVAPPKRNAKPVERTLSIEGMSCKGCAATVRTALMSVDGVQDATVTFESGQAVVKCDDSVAVATLIDTVENYEIGGIKQSYKARVVNP